MSCSGSSVLIGTLNELPRVKATFPNLSGKKGKKLGTIPACYTRLLCSYTPGGTSRKIGRKIHPLNIPGLGSV